MNKKENSEVSQGKNLLGKISEIFIKRYRVVYLIVISILIYGFMIYQDMPRESMPEVSANMIFVNVAYPGVSANDMESLVTDTLENSLESLEDLDSMTSTTRTGNSSVYLTFVEDTDMDSAISDVNNSVSAAPLPADATDPLIMELTSDAMPIMSLTMTGDIGMTELKHYGQVLEEEIEAIAGIDSVEITGGYTRQLQIIVKQSELTRYGLSINTISNSISSSDLSLPLSSMALEGEDFNLRVDESFESIEDIENIVVSANDSGYVLLKDIAEVRDGFETPSEYSYYYYNDGSDGKESEPAIYLQVFREDAYDMVQPCLDITDLIENESDEFLPEELNLIITDDQSLSVTEELDTVINSAISGFLVVIIVLFLFIGLNESLIVASVIPLSLAVALVLLDFSGMTFNTLTLTGFIVALGLLVDNTIVILENIDRLRDLGFKRRKASVVGVGQVSAAVLASSLTTMVVFVPLLNLDGTVGEMIRSLPLTIVLCILASFVVSMIITPTLSSRFLSKFKGGHKKNITKTRRNINTLVASLFVAGLSLYAFKDFGGWSILFAVILGGLMAFKQIRFTYNDTEEGKKVSDRYKELLARIMSKRRSKVLVVVLSFVLFLGSLSFLITGQVGIELFPVEDPDSMTISITAPEGYLLDDTREIVYNVEALLYEYEDIESFNSSMGGGDGSNFMSSLSSSNEAEITIEFKEDRDMTGIEIMALVRADVSTIAGADFIVDADLTQGMSSEDISVALKGDDVETLDSVGAQYYQQLLTIEGVVNPSFSSTSGAKELVIKIDDLKAAEYGYTVTAMSQEIRNQINGVTVATYTENDDDIDITIYINKDQITSVNDFEKLYFTSTRGTTFVFDDVATIEIVDAVSTIEHEDGENVVTISADVDTEYDLASVMNEFTEKTEGIELPKGVEEASGGGFADMTETLNDLLLSVVVAILLVFIILTVQFNSLHQPLVILFSVPLAVTGVMVGLVLTGNNMNFYSMMGIIALVGIAINDAIVLVDYINTLRAEGIDKGEAILEGVKTRFNPVFATSITTIGGVLPLAVFNATYGQLGIALIFGLIASTFLTLLVIPVLYSGLDTLVTKIKSKTGLMVDSSEE